MADLLKDMMDGVVEAPSAPAGPSDSTIIRVVKECKAEAERARRERLDKNKVNRAMYLGKQDWRHKQKGQSTEFLPKTSIAAEQFSAFVKRALTQFGDWFSVDISPTSAVLTEGQVKALLNCFLDRLPAGPGRWRSFSTVFSDAVKAGLFDSLIVLKVYGARVLDRKFLAEAGDVQVSRGIKEHRPWRLHVDLVKDSDYYPDPTGAGLYEIHSVERDFHQVVAAADAGWYDPAVVLSIDEDFSKEYQSWDDAKRANQTASSKPSFRRKVVIDEYWGNLLDSDGNLVAENIVCAIANGKYLIRKPEPNPLWHQESPFAVVPIVRVPHSVWHKAPFDDAAGLNASLNELFNLMLDGGIASVWGTRQLKESWLEDPSQVSGGIPQGTTLLIKEDVPAGEKVLETVTEGKVAQDAMLIFEAVNREFTAAALTNEIRLGSLPPKQVRATEVVEASQSVAVTLDGIAGDLESGLLEPFLRKAWMSILQNADWLDADDVIAAIGPQAALQLSKMPAAQRFRLFHSACAFKANGLTSTLTRVRDFQKMMALLQAVSTNPLLLRAFFVRFSEDKLLVQLMKSLNINPDRMEKNPEELEAMQQTLEQMPMFQQLTSGGKNKGGEASGGGAGMASDDVGEPSLPAEINQATNPLTGMVG